MTNAAVSPPSLPAMRAEVARVKARLADLDDFQGVWNEYARKLREIVGQMGAREAGQIPARVTKMLTAAEADRVKVKSQAPVKYDSNYIHTELGDLTKHNLRTEAEWFFGLITEFVDTQQWGAYGRKHVITANALEARLGEADGAIERKREAMKADLRAKELLVAEHEERPADGVTLGALLRKWFYRTPFIQIGRAVRWLFQDQAKKTLLALTTALAVLLAHRFFPGIEQKVRGWLSTPADTVQNPSR